MVPTLRALFLEKTRGNMMDLYAQVKPGIDPDSATELAFEAFKDAADRLMVEDPSAPYFTWYGLVENPRPNAEELKL